MLITEEQNRKHNALHAREKEKSNDKEKINKAREKNAKDRSRSTDPVKGLVSIGDNLPKL